MDKEERHACLQIYPQKWQDNVVCRLQLHGLDREKQAYVQKGVQDAEYERSFLDQEKNTSDILFPSLVENYLEDMGHRLKPTTMENKRSIIEGKLLPYFSRLKVCDIDTIKIRK